MKFKIFAYGDRTTGDGDHEATVEIPNAAEDTEYRLFVQEQLTQCFSEIFDAIAIVMTEEEWQQWQSERPDQ